MPSDQPADQRPTCGALKRDGSGGACRRPAGWGTDHDGSGRCKLHGGSTRSHRIRAFKAEAVDIAIQLGGQLDIDPADALLAMVGQAAANVVFWRERVGELDQTSRLTIERGDDGSLIDRGLIGVNHLGDGALHVVAVQYADWCDRLARYAKMAIEAGVAERQVKLAEAQGQLLADVVRAVLNDPQLGLSVEQRQASAAVVHRHLQALAAPPEAA